MGSPSLTCSALHLYPLKSAAGIAPAEASVEWRGLVGDRRWMLVDETGQFVTQRQEPRLALLQVEPVDEGLVLAGPGAQARRVGWPEPTAPILRVRVWGDAVSVLAADASVGAWLSDWLGRSVRLVYMPDSVRRPVDPAYGREGDVVSFADGYPLLLTTEASLADLNGRAEEVVPMNRFRPNVVIRGGGAYEEDRWRRIRIGPVVFRVVKPCARCVITTIDQESARPGKEPLRTLATYRRSERGKVCFGQNLIPDSVGTIRVGDPVEVLA